MDYFNNPTEETEGMTAEALLKEYDEIKKIKDLKKFIPES